MIDATPWRLIGSSCPASTGHDDVGQRWGDSLVDLILSGSRYIQVNTPNLHAAVTNMFFDMQKKTCCDAAIALAGTTLRAHNEGNQAAIEVQAV